MQVIGQEHVNFRRSLSREQGKKHRFLWLARVVHAVSDRQQYSTIMTYIAEVCSPTPALVKRQKVWNLCIL